jgi:UDP-GlcNAc:undecaprenyl-phosphate/decaprenyl-phosphate GlcNAc-1-phosphate transferase
MTLNQHTYYFIYAGFFVLSIFFSIVLNKVLLKFSKNLGARNQNENLIRWSSTSKPALGGISFFISFLLSSLFYGFFLSATEKFFDLSFVGLLVAISLAFVMGLSDDAYNTKPLLKLLVQIACGVFLIVTDTYISLFPNDILNYTLTIIWVVGIMNSINMLDNMDAITTIVSIFIILASLLTILLFNDQYHVHVIILIGVLGALFGFLRYNWNPSKMYMGDTGSQFLGVFLAALGITYFWNNKGISGDEIPTKQIIITLLAFIIPIIDTTTVTINRLRKGIPPYIGGKDHTTHHLSYMGLTDRQVAIFFACLSFISLIFIYFVIHFIENWNYFHFGMFIVYFLLVFIFLYGTTQTKKAKEKLNEKK